MPWKKKGLSRVERVIAFLEWLPITKGKLAGTKMKLLPEQREFVEAVYGRKDVRLGIKSEPRGNGKSGLCSGLALCHLLGPEAEPRGEVYSAAIDRQQAGILFNEMEAIILAVPEFAAAVNIQRFHKRIEVTDPDHPGAYSTYEALSQDARRAHGLAPSLWIYDELAQARSRELLDNLQTAMGKRNRSLGLIISTQAPDDLHPLSQILDDALATKDPGIVVHLTCAPDDADAFAEETIRACNPAADVFLDIGTILKEAERARRIPAFEPAFRNLRLNQRVDANAESRIVTRPVWEACGGAMIDPEELAGRTCYGALDLSGKHDLTSLTLVFPNDEPEPVYDILAFFWTPEGQMEARPDREREIMRTWIDAGFITATPGATIRYRYMAEQIAELRRRFDIKAIGFDRWRIDDFKADMEEEGLDDLPLEPHGQGFKDMAPAIDQLAECALTGRLRHGDNPVLTACVANAITVSDPAGNLKIDKERSNKRALLRIDGAVTLAMALNVAKRFEGEVQQDIPEDYEVTVI
ncbi:terminase large subunit [Marinicauda algicola]|nr:terminase TerL endonuclease subunit [Marinicauda algicola]